MQKYLVPQHEPSLLPDGNWSLSWQDEFDGTELDRTKWDYRLNMMGRRWPAWTDQAVHLDGKGNAVFTVMQDENGYPVSSQLQTGYNFMDQPLEKTKFATSHLQWTVGKLHKSMFTHGPGYFECRCRLQQKTGWRTAFWIQSPVIGASLDPADTGVEIDVMESFEPGGIRPHNVFTGGYGLDMQRVKVGGGTVDPTEYHRFGLLWEETGYTFFIDGKEDGTIREHLTTRPEFILISTEVHGYRRNEKNLPQKESYECLGDDFLVDYIRVFDRIPQE